MPVPVQRQKVAPDSWLHFTSLIAQIVCPPLQNDYGSEEAKKVGEELIEKERVTGLSESAQVGGQLRVCRQAVRLARFPAGQGGRAGGWLACSWSCRCVAGKLAVRSPGFPACLVPACPARRPCCRRT